MKGRILVVDDNPLSLKLTCKVLETAGIDVARAANATQAREIIRRSPPDLILMDIHLPDIGGLEFTKMLKSDERTRSIPVVALTASAMKGDEEKEIEAGCSGYICKPVDTRTLANELAPFLLKE